MLRVIALALLLAVIPFAAFASDEAVAQPVIHLQVRLAEMPVGSAVAGGIIDPSELDATKREGIRFDVLAPESHPQASPLSELVAQGAAHLLSSADWDAASGDMRELGLMIASPIELKEHEVEGVPDEYTGKLGLSVKLTPTLDDKGKIELKIETLWRGAALDSDSDSKKYQLQLGSTGTTLRLKPGVTISIGDLLTESDRSGLAILPGMADIAAMQPFFAAPTPGWVLYLLITPSISQP